MKARSYAVDVVRSEWNFSGLHQTKSVNVTTIHNLEPTLKNIRSLIAFLFPDSVIDETDATLYEQIHGGDGLDLFSVRLTRKGSSYDMFRSCSVSFMEV